MEARKPYAAMIRAQKKISVFESNQILNQSSVPVLLIDTTTEKAQLEAYRTALSHYPLADGWINHEVHLVAPTAYQMVLIYCDHINLQKEYEASKDPLED